MKPVSALTLMRSKGAALAGGLYRAQLSIGIRACLLLDLGVQR